MTKLAFNMMRSIAKERISSLLSDGYQEVVHSHHLIVEFVRLRHRLNGNRITLRIDYYHNHMQQMTNGIITYDGKIWTPNEHAV